MNKVTVRIIEDAIDKLVEATLLYRAEYRGRIVLCFKPDAFQRIQKLRKDYKRKFEFGELSQIVWEQGLPGFRSETDRQPNGFVAIGIGIGIGTGPSERVTKRSETDSKPSTNRCTDEQASEVYSLYPRKTGKRKALAAIRKAVQRLHQKGNDDPHGHLMERTRTFSESPKGQKPGAGKDDFRKHPATWFHEDCFDDDPAEWGLMESSDLNLDFVEPSDEDVADIVGRLNTNTKDTAHA